MTSAVSHDNISSCAQHLEAECDLRFWGIFPPRFTALRDSQRRPFERNLAIERSQRINEQIRISPVRVIGADGSQLGIIPTDDALRAAREADLDLVEVAPNERPPVCRIMDFGKFKYQQKKRQHRGHSHQSKIKEIRVRP